MGKEKVSIYRIAKEAGVSPATVSRVLTQNANVSDEKKIRVEKLIRKYDFSPNAMARGLTSTHSRIIGVLIPDIRNPFYAGLAVECERAANEKGYGLMLSNYMNDMKVQEHHLRKMVEQRIDALILMGGKADELVMDEEYAGWMNQICDTVPVITTGKMEGCNCWRVNLAESEGIDEVMEYLISCGHRDICLIGGRKHVNSTYVKRVRYRTCLHRHGITFRPEYMVEGKDYSVESGFAAMNEVLESGKKIPTAVIAINDFTALGILQSLRQHFLRVPEDISLVSFDNSFLAETSVPRLTSIGYDYVRYGDVLIDTSIAAIEGRMAPEIQTIPAQLVKRDSCRIIGTGR